MFDGDSAIVDGGDGDVLVGFAVSWVVLGEGGAGEGGAFFHEDVAPEVIPAVGEVVDFAFQ